MLFAPISVRYLECFLETRADNLHCLSRINRQRETPEGEIYYQYLWAAFYRKSRGSKSEDFQLYITVHDSYFETGIYFGHNVGESFKEQFRKKVKDQKQAFIELAQQLPNKFKFPVKRSVITHVPALLVKLLG